MATFYLFPSRLTVGQRFGHFLAELFPGLHWERSDWADLAEALAVAGGTHLGVYVVFREDLADEADPDGCLCRDFGAEPGDRIVEILPANLGVSHWRIQPFGSTPKAA